jgi:hypothetical protein
MLVEYNVRYIAVSDKLYGTAVELKVLFGYLTVRMVENRTVHTGK